jgi:hypothetical protein
MAGPQQVLFCPVYGLRITKEAGSAVQIGRVLFAASGSIPRIRKRIGLRFPLSHYKKLAPLFADELFASAEVYACIRTRREWENVDDSADLRAIRESFLVFASSFATYESRKDAAMSLTPVQFAQHHRNKMIIGDGEKDFRATFGRRYVRGPNQTGHWWRRNAKNNHFRYLQRIMNGTIKVNRQWKATLIKATTLFGESFLAKDVATAFLKNMIAMEMLLTERGDKFPGAIVNRLVALFGWMTDEDLEPWNVHVGRLYKLRCSYVHDGHSGDVTGLDVHSADELLRNLLENLVRNTRLIRSKHDLIRLSDECQARRVLKMKSHRPKSITFATRSLTDTQTAEINNTEAWSW